jgi:hypothetical protein
MKLPTFLLSFVHTVNARTSTFRIDSSVRFPLCNLNYYLETSCKVYLLRYQFVL